LGARKRASRKHEPVSLGSRKGGYFMIEDNEPVLGWGHETGSSRDPEVADDITIPDYVMLDFVDESFASQRNKQQKTATEP
jgi:hypothetical protein